VIGDQNKLIIREIDTTIIGGYYDRKTFSIDIDFDGVQDCKISSYAWGSSGLGAFKEASITCLNSATYLNQISIVDTIFYIRDTTIFSYGSKVRIEHYDSPTCYESELTYRMYERDEEAYTKVFTENDTISMNDFWKVDTANLALWASGGSNYNTLYESPDTVIRLYTRSFVECNGFPNDMDTYIGIKKEVSGMEKLGWIKIRISDFYIVTILEFALQE
jgi:hypothetical protein